MGTPRAGRPAGPGRHNVTVTETDLIRLRITQVTRHKIYDSPALARVSGRDGWRNLISSAGTRTSRRRRAPTPGSRTYRHNRCGTRDYALRDRQSCRLRMWRGDRPSASACGPRHRAALAWLSQVHQEEPGRGMSGCQRSPGSVNSSHRGELVGRPTMSTSKNSGSESTRRVVPCPVQFASPPSGRRVVGCL